MEEQELREAKRARNFIWTAAENYEFEPLFLAFSPDGTAELYLNLIIGLTHKWYEQEKIDAFFNQLGGKNQELYEGLLWIGLENALYQKEQKTRSALRDLRREYAEENLRRYRKYKEYSRIDQIRNGHCREILGQPSGLKEEEERILRAFSYTGDMTTEQILEQTEQNLWKYFSYRPSATSKKEGVYFLQKVSGAFHSFGKVSATYVRAKNYEDQNAVAEGKTSSMEHGKRYFLQLSVQRDPEETKRYVQACFGKSIYSEEQQEKIERKLCIGNHKNCHLLFTRGSLETGMNFQKEAETGKGKEKVYNGENELSEIKSRREKQEIREFQAGSTLQYEKNKKHFEKNRAIYRNAIRRLTEKLKICLEAQEETFPERATHGKMNPREVWKAVYLDNPRVFEKKEEIEIPAFSVDILIDASSSRKQMQEQIAAQAYILSKSLKQCNIPAQIYSYCSIRGYTILRIFKSYGEEQEQGDAIFHYVAAGNNRDGLALRAAGHMMEKSEKSGRILLVLTDASPQDDQDSGEGAFYKNKEYTDLLAIEDTAKEVQNLKQKGIRVIGIFMGSPRGGEVAGKIFGRELVKIKNISEFSEAVGRVLKEVMNS